MLKRRIDRLPSNSQDAIYDAIRQAAVGCSLEGNFKTGGDLFYFSASGNKRLGPGTLTAKIVGLAGKVSVDASPVVVPQRYADGETGLGCGSRSLVWQTTVLATSFDIDYKVRIGQRLGLTAFLIGQSGDKIDGNTKNGIYTAFLGISPFITRTYLFFGGGLFETFGARRGAAAGVNGRGVIGGGLEAVYDPLDVLRFKAIVSPLFSWAGGIAQPYGGGGRFYGLELDSQVRYEPISLLAFVLEADGIVASTFYAQSTPYWKVILSVDLMGSFSI